MYKEQEDCMMDAMCKEQDVLGGRSDRELYDGRNVSAARIWLEAGTTEESMVEAMCKE